MNEIIRVNVARKVATVEGSPVIVCNNDGYKIEFTFDSEWDGKSIKTARFTVVYGKKTYTYNEVFTGTMVDVPPLSSVDEVYVGVYSGTLKTTTPARIECKKSTLCGTGYPPEPGDDVYQQLINLFNGVTAGSAYLKFSHYSDGTDYESTWREGLDFIGIATGVSEPTNKTGFTWARFIGEKGEPGTSGIYIGAGVMPDNCNIQIDVTSMGAILRVKDVNGVIYDIPQIKGADGKDGEDGKDGLTPHIGADGNWWIGSQNTGVAAGQHMFIKHGSYEGKGTVSYSSPTVTLEFDFTPKFLYVSAVEEGSSPSIYVAHFLRPLTFCRATGSASSTTAYDLTVTWGENSIGWTAGNKTNAANHLNQSGVTYYYIAVG